MSALAAGGKSPAAEAFEGLRRRFLEAGYFEPRPVRGAFEFAVSYAMLLAAIPLLVGTDSAIAHGVGLGLSTYGMVAVATCCHTASHGAFGRSRGFDAVLQLLGFAFTFGMATTYWRHSHVETHHRHPNVVGVDYDADLSPFFLLNRDELRSRPRGMQWYYRIQGLVFPVALAFNVFSIQAAGLRFLLGKLRAPGDRREHALDLAIAALHYLVWLGLPALLLGVGEGVLLYVERMAMMGVGLFLVVGPHHYPAEAVWVDSAHEGAISDEVLRQTATCLNFRAGRLAYLFCSGADHQIEHHLFPEIAHTHYRKMQPEVEAFCREYGYPYRRNGWLEGIAKAYLAVLRPAPVQHDLEALRPAPRTPA